MHSSQLYSYVALSLSLSLYNLLLVVTALKKKEGIKLNAQALRLTQLAPTIAQQSRGSQAKLDPEHYSIKCVHERPIISPLLISTFHQLCYNIVSLTGLKITLPLCLLHAQLAFCTNRIPCKHYMRGRPIALQLLICFFYLLQLIISLTSPQITIACALLFITYIL